MERSWALCHICWLVSGVFSREPVILSALSLHNCPFAHRQILQTHSGSESKLQHASTRRNSQDWCQLWPDWNEKTRDLRWGYSFRNALTVQFCRTSLVSQRFQGALELFWLHWRLNDWMHERIVIFTDSNAFFKINALIPLQTYIVYSFWRKTAAKFEEMETSQEFCLWINGSWHTQEAVHWTDRGTQ